MILAPLQVLFIREEETWDQSLGLMVQLGDVALEMVTSDTAGVAELVQLDQPVDQAGAELLVAKHRYGHRVNGFVYSSRMPVVVNTTYVLRSVMNKRVDQLIAFRVAEGRRWLTIVWRRLEKYPGLCQPWAEN